MANKDTRNFIYFTVQTILLSIAIGLGCSYLYLSLLEDKPKSITPTEIIEDKTEEKKPETQPEENTPYENILPSVRTQYNNENILGKIEIPNVNINAYVTRSNDNSFYLSHNYYNQYDTGGAPFFDYRNTDLLNNQQINIYGHNSKRQEVPFNNLEAFIDEYNFKNNNNIYLSIDQKLMHYKIIAIKIVDDTNNEHMKVIFRGKEDFLSHIRRLLQDTLYKDDNIEISATDRILVLQACHYNPPGTYIIVIGKEIKS